MKHTVAELVTIFETSKDRWPVDEWTVEKARAKIFAGMKMIEVSDKALEHCAVKAVHVMDMTMDEIEMLNNWCNCQSTDLWEGLTLQEILNVYRASAEWDTWEGWAEED
jgi:hypothetical protein